MCFYGKQLLKWDQMYWSIFQDFKNRDQYNRLWVLILLNSSLELKFEIKKIK